ncbi:hypothetical protein BEL04_18115 [Mucilaginibacter sp. PPCGB 2223]|nr:hypothetical protein BEL04_18115 [Mucilaginibacter sp. PPCGB 2223]
MQDLLTPQQYDLLIQNGGDKSYDKDYPPVAKLFLTNSNFVWLISELDPEYPEIAFGLCDLGMGWPELGYVNIDEILACQNPLVQLENDLSFEGKYPLTVYARAARRADKIVTDELSLQSVLTLKP